MERVGMVDGNVEWDGQGRWERSGVGWCVGVRGTGLGGKDGDGVMEGSRVAKRRVFSY